MLCPQLSGVGTWPYESFLNHSYQASSPKCDKTPTANKYFCETLKLEIPNIQANKL